MKKILVTSGSWQSSLACIQSLGRRMHEVSLINEDLTASAFSRYCKALIPSPSEKNEDEYIKFLFNLIKTKSFDILIPISDSVVRYCSKHKNELKEYIKLVLPDNETLHMAANKAKLYTFANKQNIPIPKTYFPSNLIEVEELSKGNIFPCVIKTPVSVSGKGVFYIKCNLMNCYKPIPCKNLRSNGL